MCLEKMGLLKFQQQATLLLLFNICRSVFYSITLSEVQLNIKEGNSIRAQFPSISTVS